MAWRLALINTEPIFGEICGLCLCCPSPGSISPLSHIRRVLFWSVRRGLLPRAPLSERSRLAAPAAGAADGDLPRVTGTQTERSAAPGEPENYPGFRESSAVTVRFRFVWFKAGPALI